MISIELAKKLKKSGFPINKGLGIGVTIRKYTDEVPDKETEFIYFPKLDELIKECGSESFELCDIDTTHPNSKYGWRAMKYNQGALGDTPENAVANLWLLINNKSYENK